MVNTSKLNPNHNNTDQVVKIIAGAGSHTAGGKENAVLKGAIRDYLSEKSFDYWSDFENGVFLVRIKKGDRDQMV